MQWGRRASVVPNGDMRVMGKHEQMRGPMLAAGRWHCHHDSLQPFKSVEHDNVRALNQMPNLP